MRSREGLTLIEMLLVVMIIGILAAMVVPNIAGRGEDAKYSAARVDIEANLAMALDLYRLDNGMYPSAEQGLAALVRHPASAPVPEYWNGPYLRSGKLPKDPWGRAYRYVYPGSNSVIGYDLYSFGPDGEESADDIVNWADTDV